MSIMFDWPTQSPPLFTGEQGFQNPGVCLQTFPSVPSLTTFPSLAVAPFFMQGKTLKIPFFSLSLPPNPTETLLHRLMKMPMSYSLLLFLRPQKKGKKWNNSENTIKNCCTTFFQTMSHNISLHNKPRKMM